jgi:hypothetical protein
MTTERRALQREVVDLVATIVIDDGMTRFEGAILNVSSLGARVAIPPEHELPNRFYMLMPNHGMQPCRIVWRDGMSVGLKFDD